MIRVLVVFAVALATAGPWPCVAQSVDSVAAARSRPDPGRPGATRLVMPPDPQGWPTSSVVPVRIAPPGHGRVRVAQMPPDRWVAPDKLKHFFLSFGITGFAFAGTRAGGAGDRAQWFASAAALGTGLGKEVVDHRRGWGFSLRDLVWDAAGVLSAIAVLRRTR